jgi:hypothetical protein
VIEGSAEFVRATLAALALLDEHDPPRSALVARYIRRLTGLSRWDTRRLGRATLYDREWRALVPPVEHTWIDRRHGHCFVHPSVWNVALDDQEALRYYAAVLVHEAAHLYLDTHDETACNAEMQAALGRLAEAG